MKINKYFKGFVLSIAAVLVFSSVGPSIGSAALNNSKDLGLEKQIITQKDFDYTQGLDPEKDKDLIDILEGIEIKIIKDDENERVVETIENGVTSIGVFNKKNNELTTEVKGNKSSQVKIDLDEVDSSDFSDDQQGDISTFAATRVENTYSNYEYTITYTSPQKWQLRRPKPNTLNSTYYKNVTLSKKNSGNLNNFKKQVDLLNDYELKFIGAASGATILWLASLVVASLNGGAGVAVALVAVGVTGAAYNYGIAVERSAKNAQHYYFSI